MESKLVFPTPEHEAAAQAIVDFWTSTRQVEAVLVVNSCARGKATKDSCLDINVLVQPEIFRVHFNEMEKSWELFNQTNPVIQKLKTVGKYSVVHLDVVDGIFEPTEQDEAAGPDGFELGVGNLLAYGVPIWQKSDYLAQLQQTWLPYYNESLRTQRLAAVRFFCLNNLGHIPLMVNRGLYFQAFDRLYNAHQEFLQALFISRRTYPITYNKWIHEQIVDILNLPELYDQLIHLLEIHEFTGQDITKKGQQLEQLLEEYVFA